MVFPNETLISKDKELEELRNSYNSLLKLVEEISQNESKGIINAERIKEEKEKYKKRAEQLVRNTT